MSNFLKNIYTSPSLIWKAGAGVLFLILAVVVFAVPDITSGFTARYSDTWSELQVRSSIAGIFALYGCFRLFSFYLEYRNSTSNE